MLLVEDDASIRQFVSMALEDQPLQLLTCPTLKSARQALKLTGPDLALVLLDMMLPDGSGLDLLRDPLRLRPEMAARWVVFSAGLSATTRQALEGLEVNQVLDKPVSLDRLLGCITAACLAWHAAQDGLESSQHPGERYRLAPSPRPNKVSATATAPASAQLEPRIQATGHSTAQEAAAIQNYFFGQEELFMAMKQQAQQRLVLDIQALEGFLTRQDAQELRRAAHNLKSVTRMLGQARAADLARALEDAASSNDIAVWQGLWNGLRAELELWHSGA